MSNMFASVSQSVIQRWRMALTCLALGVLMLVGPAVQAQSSVSVVFNSPEQFDACLRDGGIDVSTQPGAVVLAPSELVLYDMGNKLGGRVSFSDKSLGKKVFDLDTLGASKAEIYLYNGNGKATFNNAPVSFKPVPFGSGTRGAWSVALVDAARLKQGKNELVFQSGFSLAIDRERVPAQQSFASGDGGKTWTPAPGEYLVHLRLYRHPAQGVITSEVIDLANPTGKDAIAPLTQVQSLTIKPTVDTPEGTSVLLEARSGPTLRPDADAWSNWVDAKSVKPARFVQWRAILTTKDRAKTPTLKQVTLEAQQTIQADPAALGLKLDQVENAKIVRSSYPFEFQRPSSKLQQLRTQFKLDEVVAAGKTEFEKYILLRNWVRKQWPHNDAGSGKRTWDAIEILSAPAGQKGMCVHYGVTFTQCALALGYNARQIILQNHYVSEIWSNEHRKWVLLDVEAVQKEGWDRYGTALYLDRASHTPLNGLELHKALMGNKISDVVQELTMTEPDGQFKVNQRTYGPEEYGNFQIILFPPRNNYLDQLDPWEEWHGEDHYHSDIYLWWKDQAAPLAPEYSTHTSRQGDILWSVNQVAITLTATAKADELNVGLDTYTPNLKAFAYRVDGGPWQMITNHTGVSPHDRQATFTWPLKNGTNKLEVKPLNAFDREGVVGSISVVRGPGQ